MRARSTSFIANLSCPSVRRKVALGLALLMGASLASHSPVYGRSRHAKRQSLSSRLSSIKDKQKETRAELQATKGRQRDVIGDLHQIQDALALTARWIDRSERRLSQINADLTATQAKLADNQEKLASDKARLARRIVAARRSGDCGYLNVALGAENFQDFLQRGEFVNRIVQSDVALIKSVRDRIAEVKAEEAKIAESRSLQQGLMAALSDQREQQKQKYAEQKEIYDRLKRERADLEAVYAQQERDSESVRQMLENLAQTPEGHARAVIAWTGSFSRPVMGPMTSGFGRRFHPILHRWKLHTGVDFGVPVGTPVHAAANGVVVHAGWLGAYGNAVIIDHGGGISTLYGHNSYVDVSVGQSVSAGDVISHSGSTGYSTGPHVHFEKRVNGTPVPPF